MKSKLLPGILAVAALVLMPAAARGQYLDLNWQS
jgi:hypothetical protein